MCKWENSPIEKSAITIARLVKDGRYFDPYLPQEEYGELRVSVMKRSSAVKNMITAILDEYFPELAEVFKNPLKGKASRQILRSCPFPALIKDLPEDEREAAAVLAIELHKAEKEYQSGVNAVDNNTKIAKSYSHAFEKVVMLDVSERNVRTWIEWCGIRKDEIRDMINESKESIEKFSLIVEILEGIYEKQVAPYEHFDEETEDIAQTV